MKIAIIGAGFTGLACTFYACSSQQTTNVALFDRSSIGAGASGVAAGCMHPYAPYSFKYAWQGPEALKDALELIDIASQENKGDPPLIRQGLCRLFLKDEAPFPTPPTEATIFCKEKIKLHFPYLDPVEHMCCLHQGYSVDTKRYLKNLWRVCERLGAGFEKRNIQSFKELEDYDHIIACTGAYAREIEEAKDVAISQQKGQLLTLAWDPDMQPPQYPLHMRGYLVMAEDAASCYAGATFERSFQDPFPDRERAEAEIRKKLHEFSPACSALQFLDCQAGLRAYAKNRLPLIVPLSEKHWMVSGMGSKGLLYHAFCAKTVMQQMGIIL